MIGIFSNKQGLVSAVAILCKWNDQVGNQFFDSRSRFTHPSFAACLDRSIRQPLQMFSRRMWKRNLHGAARKRFDNCLIWFRTNVPNAEELEWHTRTSRQFPQSVSSSLGCDTNLSNGSRALVPMWSRT